ncbi:hypothetical protein TYRP_003855 [Tyrophagus putrescentiae]|nr:hypothetical protein TYRP_003855 [Tyrophagus putrescentiae]
MAPSFSETQLCCAVTKRVPNFRITAASERAIIIEGTNRFRASDSGAESLLVAATCSSFLANVSVLLPNGKLNGPVSEHHHRFDIEENGGHCNRLALTALTQTAAAELRIFFGETQHKSNVSPVFHSADCLPFLSRLQRPSPSPLSTWNCVLNDDDGGDLNLFNSALHSLFIALPALADVGPPTPAPAPAAPTLHQCGVRKRFAYDYCGGGGGGVHSIIIA